MNNLSDNTRGALLMAASMAAFTFNDTFMKALLVDIPVAQALCLRGALNVVMVFAVVTRFIGPVRWRLSGRDWSLVALRSLGEVGAAFCFLISITLMPLANAAAITQTLPLTITIASALLFREALGWRRLLAIAIGFGGVVLIVKPGTEGFNIGSLWALGAMLCVVVRDLATKVMSDHAPTSTVTLAAAAAVALAGAVAQIGTPWEPLDLRQVGLLFGSSGFVILGYVLSIVVMKVGEISFVSPFRYTGLIWALITGFLFFGEWPKMSSLVGAAIIAATGIYTVLREARLRREARMLATEK